LSVRRASSADISFKHFSPDMHSYLQRICADYCPAITMLPQLRIVWSPHDFLADLCQERTPVHRISNSHVHASPLLWFPGQQLVVVVLGINLLRA
jgi:hypothetical protein